MAVELVKDDVGLGVALQFDDDAQSLAVAFVAQIGNALDQFLAHGLGDALDQPCFVDLIRQLGEDDRLALLAHFLDMGFRSDVRRLPITELGCAAGAAGLGRAWEHLRAFPTTRRCW